MSPSPSPTFIFVPGAWHGPAAFSSTIHLLAQRGYPSSAVALKSVDASPPLQNFDPDVEAVRSAVEAVVSKGGDVVLVMHSYGGIPGSEAMKYFLDGNEGEDGRARRGRVVRMVWICAFVGPVGGCLFERIGGKDLPWFRVDGDIVNPANPKDIFYNDLSPAAASPWIAALKPHSYRTLFSKLSVEPWRTIPAAYLVCEADNAIPAAAQEGMIAMAQGMAPGSFDVVERCGAGHSPFLSVPETCVAFLVKCAGGA